MIKIAGEPKNKQIIRRYYNELWNKWNLALANELVAPDVSFRGSLAVEVQGLEGFKGYVNMVRAAFPDFHNTIEDLIAEDNKVVARLTYNATHRGEIFGVAPTGKKIKYSGVAIFHIVDNKIVNGWVLGDTPTLMRQIGKCMSENLKSRRIPETLGFMQEGVVRKVRWRRDHFDDHVVYGVLAREWQP